MMKRPALNQSQTASPGAALAVQDEIRSMPTPVGRIRAAIDAARAVLVRYGNLLWWIHSAYALLLGILLMWLGSTHFQYLRIVVFQLAFIWLSSLFLPVLSNHPRIPGKWQERIRLAINYFNKNYYQQLLFFLLPIYYATATFGSQNMLFVALLAVSAVLSTLDIVYDRYLSVRWPLTALFFAFNLFACINVMLPILFSISNHRTLWISAMLAVVGFGTILYRLSSWPWRTAKIALPAAAATLFAAIFLLRSFIPPAPLRLVSAEFGCSVQALHIVSPLAKLPPGKSGKIAVLTAIKAPLGLRERVRHCWYLGNRLLYSSPYYSITGGRKEGYRLWTEIT